MKRAILALSFALLAPVAVIQPVQAQEQPEPGVSEERLPHISVTLLGTKGTPVILIPGLASPRAVWDGVAPELAKTHRVYLVQVNGFGGDAAGDNAKPGILDGITVDLDDYIRRHKLERPAIIGHSMGGLLAMMMGARFPQSTGRILVVDSLPFLSLLYGPTATVEAAKPYAEQARAQTLATPPAAAPVTSDPGGIWSNTPAGRIKVANWAAKADPRVSGQALYEVMITDIRPELGRIKARPFTVLYATGAGPQAKLIWENGYTGSPAQLVPIAGSWHFIMLDQPGEFTRAVKSFVDAP